MLFPLDLQEQFSAHMRGLLQRIPSTSFLLAVSGGADSIALLYLMHHFIQKHAPHFSLSVATMDHQLRPESADEVKKVAHLCAALKVTHHAVIWEGEKPVYRLQERAREARYALLHNLCLNIGATTLMTAHHYDDQLETFFMRLLKGSGTFGLLGMKEHELLSHYHFIHTPSFQKESPPISLVRPLLPFSKKKLIEYLAYHDISFVCDPSNENQKFTRVKWRQILLQMEAFGFDLSHLKKTFHHMEEEQHFLQKYIEIGVTECFKKGFKDGRWILDRVAFLNLDPFLQKRVMRSMLDTLSDKKYPPKFKKIAACVNSIGKRHSFTCGGYTWRFHKDMYVLEKEKTRSK